jgi:rod shape-determining protein MreD
LKEIIFLFAVATVALGLQSTSVLFLLSAAYKPDLILILVVWAGLRASYTAGVGFAFVAGLCVDVLSGSPTGLFALIYCLVLVTSGYVDAIIPIDDPVGWMTIVFLATLFSACIVLIMRWLAGPVGLGPYTVAWILLKSLLTGMVGVAVIPCLDRVWAGYARIIGEQ